MKIPEVKLPANRIIYVDMDDVLCDFMGSYKYCIKKNPEMKYPQSRIYFFRDLEPLNGAINAFKKLSDLPNTEVYILSAPSEYNPLSYTEKRIWVETHLGFDTVSKLILSSNKSLLKGDYLIDDYTEGKGQEKFEGKLINFGSEEFLNWDSVLEFFSIKCFLQDVLAINIWLRASPVLARQNPLIFPSHSFVNM